MGITRPYKRICRQFVDGTYSASGQWRYLYHHDFAQSPEQYVRAFLLIQKDLQALFDYVEPSDVNDATYSYRIHELLLRTCVEVEANCKAILTENSYVKATDLNMDDYKKINFSHHLSSYEVKIPLWYGANNVRKPFANWASGGGLIWYKAYNLTKHDRHEKFKEASFNNLIDSVCGLVAILSSQFYQESYMPGHSYELRDDETGDGMEVSIGEYFRVKFPEDWTNDEQYEFTADDIADPSFAIQKFDFNNINP